MLKKLKEKIKGFTLVELLAVIAILAIILLIAIPQILGVINQAKEAAFRNSVRSVFKAIELLNAQGGNSEGKIEDLDLSGERLTGMWSISNDIITLTNIANSEYCVSYLTETNKSTDFEVTKDCIGLSDSIPTIILPNTDGENGYYKTEQIIIVNYNSNLLDGYEYAISIDGGTTYSSYTTTTANSFVLSENSETIFIKVRGVRGSEYTEEVISEVIKMDIEEPVITLESQEDVIPKESNYNLMTSVTGIDNNETKTDSIVVTSSPEFNINKSNTYIITYSLKDKAGHETIKTKKVIVTFPITELATEAGVVTTGEGLYADTAETGLDTSLPYSSKYYYKGGGRMDESGVLDSKIDTLNNHLVFENNCYRIVNIAQNNTVKIFWNGNLKSDNTCRQVVETHQNNFYGPFDINNVNNFLTSSLYNTYIKTWEKNSLITSDGSELIKDLDGNPYPDIYQINYEDIPIDKTKLANATWYIGAIKEDTGQTLLQDITYERTYIGSSALTQTSYTGYIGLLNVSDGVKASYNSACTSIMTGRTAIDGVYPCSVNNYLLGYGHSKMTLNARPANTSATATIGTLEGTIMGGGRANVNMITSIVLYLNASNYLSGTGAYNNPYIVH